MTAAPVREEALGGAAVLALLTSAAAYLRTSAAMVDAINVYPVPDGDTGSNMAATLQEAVDRASALGPGVSTAAVLGALAKGALYGARGNSGVILSQALRGFAEGAGALEVLGGESLAKGLERAAERAYQAVGTPMEGTMLTVLRAAAQGASACVTESPGAGCAQILDRAIRAAEDAEAATIDQLPQLHEAGVPDAGGEGVCVILRGLLASITGGTPPAVHPANLPILSNGKAGHERFGYCTEFLVEPRTGSIDLAALRALAEGGGHRSVVVVGDEALARVHVHTLDPERFLAAAGELGELRRVKVEDMSAQHARFTREGSGAGAKVAILAMSRGAGFDAVFEGLGAAVSDLGVVEKPSAGQIAAAADALLAPDVIVLPNHKNVVLAAEQARAISRATLHIAPAATLVQGIAAAMAFDPDETASTNLAAMAEATSTVRTVEVTVATTARRSDGVAVREGQALALLDGRLVAAVASPAEALAAGIAAAKPGRGALVTLYAGEHIGDAELEGTTAMIRAQFPGVDVEALRGDQPLYTYIASIE